jgi:arylsulfatase
MSKHSNGDKPQGKSEEGRGEENLSRRNVLLAGTTFAAASIGGTAFNTSQVQAQPTPSGRPPNILVIFGDGGGSCS